MCRRRSQGKGRVAALATVLAFTVACGGNSPTSPSLPGSTLGSSPSALLSRGTMSATVDGARWATATPVAMIGSAVGTLPALITVSGATSLSGMLLSVTVPAVVGTYSLDGSTFLSCSVSENITTRWSASPFDRNSYCTVTVTNASSTRVAGTYSFTASASTPGASPASRTVTNGVFDVSQ